MPAAFRMVVASLKTEELYCFQDFVFPAISAGGPAVLERFERQISTLNPFSEEANRMSLVVHGGGVFIKLDQEGRLMVTDFIRQHTGITSEVTFVGRADYFQLWQPQAFEDMQALARQELRRGGPVSRA